MKTRDELIDDLLTLAFAEDVGDGDATTLSTIPATEMGRQHQEMYSFSDSPWFICAANPCRPEGYYASLRLWAERSAWILSVGFKTFPMEMSWFMESMISAMNLLMSATTK